MSLSFAGVGGMVIAVGITMKGVMYIMVMLKRWPWHSSCNQPRGISYLWLRSRCFAYPQPPTATPHAVQAPLLRGNDDFYFAPLRLSATCLSLAPCPPRSLCFFLHFILNSEQARWPGAMVTGADMTMNSRSANIMVIASPFDCAQDFASNHESM